MRTYRMGSVFGAVEVNHAINAGKGRATTLVAMRVELFLGEHVAAGLVDRLD